MFKAIRKANLLIFCTCLYLCLESSYAESLKSPLTNCSDFLTRSSTKIERMKDMVDEELLYNSARRTIRNAEVTQEELAQILETLEISEPLRTDLMNKVTSMLVQSHTISLHTDVAKITKPNLQGHLLRNLAIAWERLALFEKNITILTEVKDKLTLFLVDLMNIPVNRTSRKSFKKIEDAINIIIRHVHPPTRESVNILKLFASLVEEMKFDVKEEGENKYTRSRNHTEDITRGHEKAKRLLKQFGFLSPEDFGDFIARVRWIRRLSIYHNILNDTELSSWSFAKNFFISYPYTLYANLQKHTNIIRQDIENPYLVQNDLIAMLELLQSKGKRPNRDFHILISTYEEPLLHVVDHHHIPNLIREQVNH